MRESLLGSHALMDGPLWTNNLGMARVLAATIPSGNPSVVQLREDLASLLSGPTRYPMVPANWTTQVINISTIERPWPSNYIYIGHGPRGSGFNPSPWGPRFARLVFQPTALMTVGLKRTHTVELTLSTGLVRSWENAWYVTAKTMVMH